jgi:hypothetical protein
MNVVSNFFHTLYNLVRKHPLLSGLCAGIGAVLPDALDHWGENPSRAMHIPGLLLVGILLGIFIAYCYRLRKHRSLKNVEIGQR